MKKITIEIKKNKSKLKWELPERISEILGELPDYAREDLLRNAKDLMTAVLLLITGSLYAPACAMLMFPRAFKEVGRLYEEAIEMGKKTKGRNCGTFRKRGEEKTGTWKEQIVL